MHVPEATLVIMAFSCALGVIIPVTLLVYFRRRGADIAPFFVGCAVMLLFAFVLEAFAHQVILNSEAGARIASGTLLFALYGGAMAGLFEETGRFLAFKTVLRSRQGNDRNALMYGAGHGGFEAFVILTFGMMANLMIASAINTGVGGELTEGLPSDILFQVETVVLTLVNTPPAEYLLAPMERIVAIALHISFSVLVWFAAKNGRLLWLFPATIVMHALIDSLVVLVPAVGIGPLGTEFVFMAFTAAVILFARYIWVQNTACIVPDPHESSRA